MKKIFLRTASLGFAGLMVVLLQPSLSTASLIYLGDYTVAGEGYGAVDNILSLHKSGGTGTEDDVEWGKVAWSGSIDVVTGDNYVTGAGKTATINLGGFTDASQIGLVWDPSETGGGEKNVVNSLIMTIYTEAGASIFSASYADAPIEFTQLNNPGLGKGDYFFGLDTTQAGLLNTAVGENGGWGNVRIGLESNISFVDDGQDTWILAKGPGNPVPEPATMLLFGTGLIGVAGIARRKRN